MPTSRRPAPIVEVSGRTYPVEVRYRPLVEEGRDDEDEDGTTRNVRDQIQAISDAVDELAAEGPGDILVFLSGEREIRDTADALGKLVQTSVAARHRGAAAVRPAVDAPSSTACSSRTAAGGSCWRPTSPRPR